MPLPSPKFPTRVATAADLLLQINFNASLTLPSLASGMAPGDTSFTVAAGTGAELPTDNFVVTIDNEIIFVTSRTGDVCTVGVRGFEGTTAASHSSGTQVNAFITALAHNQLASEINSVESQLGAGMKNVATTSGAADGQVPIFNAAQQQFIPGDPIVSGPDAPGSAPTRNPVQIGGFDGTNVQRISCDTSGKLQIGGSISVTSGTLTANQGSAAALSSGWPVKITDGTNVLGTLANPIRTDPVGTTSQPITAASLPLPANAAQETGGNLAILAGTVSAGKVTVTVSGSVTVSGTVTANQGSANATPWNENLAQWGGTAVSAPPASGVPPAGTEVAPVTKPIQRKSQDLLSTAVINASATFTSAWFDSQQTGAVMAIIGVFLSASGAGSLSVKFDTTDDPTQTNFSTQAFTPAGTGTYASFLATITGRYWRLRFINGANAQNSPILAVTTFSNSRTLSPSMGGNTNDGLLTTLLSVSVSDIASAGFWANANNNSAAAAASAQYAITSAPATGANWAAVRTPNVFKTIAAVAVTAGTPQAIWTPTSGKKFRVMGFMLSLSVAGSVILKDASTEILRTPLMAAGIGLASPPMGNGILSALANNALNADVSATGSVSGFVYGTEE